MPFDHHLGDAISNRGDPQRAHPAIALRYVDPPHRWRKVAAGRQTIPKFIEVVFKISLKIRNHLAVYASRPLVGSDPLIGFPHLPFWNIIRLGSITPGPVSVTMPRIDTAYLRSVAAEVRPENIEMPNDHLLHDRF